MIIDINQFKEKLLAEKSRLEEEMSDIARKNPSNPEDWQIADPGLDTVGADENEVADKFEEMVDNRAVLNELEIEHSEVNDALKRIESGKYGKCDKCGKDLSEERLKAYSAARDCVEHSSDS